MGWLPQEACRTCVGFACLFPKLEASPPKPSFSRPLICTADTRILASFSTNQWNLTGRCDPTRRSGGQEACRTCVGAACLSSSPVGGGTPIVASASTASASTPEPVAVSTRVTALGAESAGGCRVQGAGCRVQGAGFRVQGAGFRVQGAPSWPLSSRGRRHSHRRLGVHRFRLDTPARRCQHPRGRQRSWSY